MFEVGRVVGTSALFVVTEERVIITHADTAPARRVSGYLADVAIARLESGNVRLRDLAHGLGVTEDDLRSATRARGYAGRPSTLTAVRPT